MTVSSLDESFAFVIQKVEQNTSGYGEKKRTTGVTLYGSTFAVFDDHSEDESKLEITLPWELRRKLMVGDVITLNLETIDANGYHLQPRPQEEE